MFWRSASRQSSLFFVANVLVNLFLLQALFSAKSVFALELNFSDSSDWNAGTKTNLDSLAKEGDLSIDPLGVFGAKSWRTPDLVMGVGTALTSDGTNIYAARGLGDVLFWKYSSVDNTWTELAIMPRGAFYGSELEYLDGFVYATFGGYQKAFARYSVANNTWEMLSDLPDVTYSGTSLEKDGTDIYAIRGNGTQDFYKYDVSSNSWSPLAGLPATVAAGADLVRVGNYIYTPRGSNTNTFYRYDISANSWSAMANVPATINDDIELATNGSKIFVTRGGNTTSFYAYDIAGNSWSTLTNLPAASRYAGAIYNSSEGYVYVFRGNSQYDFWKYDPVTNSFLGASDAPATLSTGSDMLRYGGDLYILRGSNSTTFYKYNLATDTWSTLAAAPASMGDEVDGVVVGAYIYFFRGSNTNTFYRYDIVANSWTTLANAPATVRFGGALAYPGSGDYIYASRGNSTLSFWRYSISSNSWDDLAVNDLPADAESSYGSGMISDGTDIFYIAGIGISRFLKYTIATNTWSEVAAPPFSPYYGTDLAYYSGQGKILALAGWFRTEFYEYSVSEDSWRRLKDIPGYLAQGLGPYTGAALEYDGNGAFYLSYGNGRVNLLSYTPESEDYPDSGTWISDIKDLGYISSFVGLNSSQTTPSDASIIYETRTSADGENWSSWAGLSGGLISSPAQRYLQIRVTLISSTDYSVSPTLHSLSVSYNGDVTVPSNPNSVSASSQEVSGQALLSGGTYKHIHPYFSWSGASDSETGVEGYYVYFGTNQLADPVAVGIFQTESDYIVTEKLSTGTYYLLVKTKDEAGNISETSTLFTYNYNGISPPQSLTVTDFLGTAADLNASSNQLKLVGRSGGFWLEETLSNAPAAVQYGAENTAYLESTGKLYVFRGNNSAIFYSYDLATDAWSTLANAPGNIYIGGGVVEGPSGYLYGLRGNNTSSFYRYDVATDSWSDEDASDTPLAVYYGAAMEFDGNGFVYLMRGNNDDAFWRYNTVDDSWESLANLDFSSAVNNNTYAGADLAIDVDNDLIYASQGNYRDGFAVYDINTNDWTALPSLPQLPYLGSSIEYVASNNSVYYTPGNLSDKMFRFSVAEQTWTEISSSPTTLYYGSSIRNIDNHLYSLAGNNTTTFYKYNIAKDSWLIPNRGLFGRTYQGVNYIYPSYGADVVKGDSNYFYLVKGNYSDDFVRYNYLTGEMIQMASAPVGTYSGSSLVFDNVANKIYLTGGVYLQRFYVYDIATNTWSEEVADPTPAITDYGSSMIYDGSRYIYLTRGGNTNSFYRFDTQGSAGSKWTSLPNVSANLGYGSELVFDGDNYIYVLRGQNVGNNPFYRFDIAANSWSDVAVSDLNTTIYNDGFAVFDGQDKIYVAKGANTKDFYQYSISNDTWTQLGSAPVNIYQGGAGESNGSDRMVMYAGNGTGAFDNGIYTYVFPTANSAFVEDGEYISETHNLSVVYKWINLEVDYDEADNTSLSIQTRSSSDGSEWSAWTAVASEKKKNSTYTYEIKSPPAPYLQVKFNFTSNDGIYSGVINGYTINYYKDEVEPSNPQTAGLAAYSNSSPGETLVSGNWYGHIAPYFTWPTAESSNGASDASGGSGVAGYYVYFGTDNTADPYLLGSLQVGNEFTASNLVNGSTYYLRVKAIDGAGNMASETWAPFVYKYDAEAASAPTDLVSDPSGYTSVNSFNFSWDNASSSGALVTEYCYKTGVSTGDYATDQCTSDTFVNAVPSYKVGVNTFYVRSKDEAGNYSSYASAPYYYVDSDNAPAPPTNLVVTPSSNTENSFAFSWDPPAVGTFYGSEANLSYYYSINALPTAQSTTATSLKSLLAGAYATLPGENVFYIVTKDEAGNINYSNYASVTFTANTTAPGIPLNMDIADVSVKSTSSWKIALSWEAPTAGSVSHYAIHRSSDGETFSQIATSGGISYVDTGLSQQTYYYKVKACDSTNNCGAFSEVVELFPDGKFVEAAELTAEPTVSNITTKKATISWSTARTADSRIAYGESSGQYFDEEVSNSLQVTSHILTLPNLSPGKTYYFVARWTDEDGNLGESAESTFTTAPAPSTAEPVIKSLGLDSALLEFTTKNANKVRIYYGETAAFGGMTEVFTGVGESTHSVQITDLKDGIKYYYKINAFDSEGEEYEGEIHSFETLPRPKISAIKVSQVKGTARSTLLINWESNTEVSSVVTYYPTANPGVAKDEVNLALKSGKHQMVIYDLEPQTNYTILVKGKDAAGNEAIGEAQQVATSADTRSPQISDLKVEGEIIGAGEEATAQLVISFNTDEPATAQIEFGEGSGSTYSQKTQEDSSLTSHHIVVISGLAPSKVYHLRALSKDSYGNLGQSIDKVVVTPKAADNALDLVISNMSLIFGFLAN